MSPYRNRFRQALLGASALAVMASASPAFGQAREVQFDQEPQPLSSALREYGFAADQTIIFAETDVGNFTAPALKGRFTPDEGLGILLAGTGLIIERTDSGILRVRSSQDPQGGSAAGDGAEVEALIVTAQKKEEAIQDIPIAISAFTQKSLDAQKIEGGFDLLKAIPNVTFSKTNFSSYNFSIRGIGTQAVSVTTDPGVAVAQNNTTLIVNRLFEQEYVDMERVEVLRGPQGTLYGRNATAGVINVITAKPRLGDFFGEAKLETGNFNAKRFRGHVNVPIGETLAVRGAFALTQRDGYGFNEASLSNDTREFGDTVRPDVDGRDLWTARVTVGWEPTENIRVNAIWERFKEDDNRVRTSKQLCHHDEGPKIPTSIQGAPGFATEDGFLNIKNYNNSLMSQACKPGSLYAGEAFGTPNGAAIPYISGMFVSTQIGSNNIASTINGYQGSNGIGGKPWGGLPLDQHPCPDADTGLFGWGGPAYSPVDTCNQDPYGGRRQSSDLRTIYSAIEPTYRAEADIFELSVDFDLGGATFTSQTVYSQDDYYASQDYNRFTSMPLWNDTSEACNVEFNGIFGKYSGVDCSDDPDTGVGTFAPLTDLDGDGVIDQTGITLNGDDPMRQQSGQYAIGSDGYVRDESGRRVGFYRDLAPGGVFCDPQLGCSNSLVAQDLSQAKSRQFNQEFRLVTNYEGPFNFSLGANYTRFETSNDYYVFINALSYLTNFWPFNYHAGPCATLGLVCRYVDPSPLESVAGDGHNYFRSQNPYKLTSTAIFGETYWEITETLKLTTGLRLTWDEKTFSPVASQLLLADYREVSLAHALLPDGIFGGLGNLPEGGGPDFCITPFGVNDDLHCPLTGTAPGGRGLVASPDIVQTWREPTGRIVIDWKPDLSFTDDTMVYASVARGYKGGGANPPSVAPPAKFTFDAASGGAYPDVFDPEYVKAFEVGTKNTLLGGGLVLNGGAFYYDYTDYQVSKIADRRAVNENFDAKIWGAEFEWVFSPMRDLRFNGTVGYLRTEIAEGERSIDLMDRTDGGNRCYNPKEHNPDSDWDQEFCEWMTLQPFVNAAALSIVPVNLIQANANPAGGGGTFNLWNYYSPNGGPIGGAALEAGYYDEDGNLVPTGASDRDWFARRDAPNGGAGFFKDLGGNELPSAPRWTFSLGAQYRFVLPGGWDATIRSDFYWQDDSWARVYNLEGYDKLKAWTNTNLSLWVENPDWGVKAEVYAKNVFDETPITGAFLNSEDSGLTTNVFTLDPRLIGASVTKTF